MNPQPGPYAQPAQLEVAQPHGQSSEIEREASEYIDPSSLRGARASNLAVNSEISFPALLSPKTPIREEDPLQGARSATSTPCGPIPASVQPAPVKVLGYSPSQRSSQMAIQHGQNLPTTAENSAESSSALNQAATSRRPKQPPPSPLRETRSSTRKKRNTSLTEDMVSAVPESPLPSADIAVMTDHDSPKRRTPRTRSTSSMSSPRPLANNHSQAVTTQDEENSCNMETRSCERTPVAEGSPPIGDALLAGSQVLSLIQPPISPASAEIFLAIPLNDIQRALYRQALLENYKEVEVFLGIHSPENGEDPPSIDRMQNYIRRLDATASHADLSDDQDIDYGEAGPKLVKWFCKQSSKFALLATLLEKLRDEAYTVAIVAEGGKLMECLDIFLKSAGHNYTRYNAIMDPMSSLPEKGYQKLHVSLIPSAVSDCELTMPPTNLVLGFDSSLDSSSSHIKELRRNRTSSAALTPIIHFVPINTIAHIIQCIPSSTKSNHRQYISAILFAAVLIRKDVGVLPQTLLGRLETLSSASTFSWLESLQTTPQRVLPALPIDTKSQSTQSDNIQTQEPTLTNSPTRKRVLSISATPAAPGGNYKKARVEALRAQAPPNEDIPMEDFDYAADEMSDVEAAGSESAEPVITGSPGGGALGDISHITDTMPEAFAKCEKPTSAGNDGAIKAEHENMFKGTLGVFRSGEQTSGETGDISDEVLLESMSKEELIELLLGCKEQYHETKEKATEFEKELSALQDRYEESRQKIRELKAELRDYSKRVTRLANEAEAYKSSSEVAKLESDQAKADLTIFQKALSDRPEGEATRAAIIKENGELKPRVSALEHKLERSERDMEFLRDQYQISSHANGILLRQKNEFEEQAGIYMRKADETKIKLKALNWDRERSKYQSKIKELQAKVEIGNRHNAALDAEKKRAERSRGLQTRSSSIPPRPVQSSPAPTRPTSPTTATSRHPLRGVDVV
ncbi:hypothetical protein DRE_06286 [Drechslerella stenobrocha 248]|uniref:Uncharacterized protein n=1 Tax=Drechslerella stenobrocha 248 TaxID=1043628 RepID=W7HLZ9_9PEZI|nr:hypothetical protein DRE_06286 [Drechslerella stenobrocha 248]